MSSFQKLILIGILLFLGQVINAQRYIEYYRYVHSGEYYFNSKLYDEAINQYNQAFSIASPFGIDIYRMAKCQCGKGFTSKTLKYLKLTGKIYSLEPSIFLSRDSIFLMNCLSKTQFKGIKSKMTKDYFASVSELRNSENYKYLVDTVNYYIIEDQKFRNKEENPCIEEANPSFDCDSWKLVWYRHDSLLYDQFIEFIKENGYPRLAGELSYVILLHFHESHYKRSKEMLISEVNRGNIDPFFLGMMFDRLDLLLYGKECNYFIWSKECNENDWNQIIANRQTIGMSVYYNGPRVRGEYNKELLPWVISKQ